MLFDPMGLRVVEGSRLPLGAWVRAWLAVGRGGPVTGASWWIRVCRWKSVWGGVVVDQGVSVEVCVGCGLRMPPFPGTVSPLLACGRASGPVTCARAPSAARLTPGRATALFQRRACSPTRPNASRASRSERAWRF